MMASGFRIAAAFSLFLSTVSTYGIGERLPTKTVNYGAPHLVVKPTEAPSWDLFHDLLKLKARVVTNICTEWTLLGVEGGQPACTGSSTCLFDTISGYGYEACALTSSSYYQVTQCWNYPKTYVVSPVGQIFCGYLAPYCGYYEFIFDNGDAYSNFGCSTEPYSSTATLIPGALSSYTPEITNSIITTAAPSESAAPTQNPLIVTANPTTTSRATQPPVTNSPSFVTTDSNKKSTPIGAVVGGVVGGIAVIGAIAAIIGCLCYKKRKARRQQEAEPAAATAAALQASQNNNNNQPYNPNNPNNRYSELGGMGKPQMTMVNNDPPPGPVAYTNEKPGMANQYQEMQYNQQQQPQSPLPSPQSPPPVYHQPAPAQQYQELTEEGRTNTVSPVSAMYTGSSGQEGLGPRPHSNAMELSGVGNQGGAPVPGSAELGGTQNQNPRPAPQQVDMNGAPMNENYHELHG